MARDLLSGELRILESASAWLKNYCATLMATDCHRDGVCSTKQPRSRTERGEM